MELAVSDGGGLASKDVLTLFKKVEQGMYCDKGSQFSHSVVSDSLPPHGLQHIRLPCPSLTPGVYSNSYPSSQ